MRNPDRIDNFCKELAKIWKHNACNWRFGQLICNVFGEIAMEVDPFFPEENEMLEYFRDYFGKNGSQWRKPDEN